MGGETIMKSKETKGRDGVKQKRGRTLWRSLGGVSNILLRDWRSDVGVHFDYLFKI